MDASFLIVFKWIVVGAMYAVLGIIALVCGYYFLRWQAFRPTLPIHRSRKKSRKEKEDDGKRRDKVRFWFWYGG